MPVRCRVELRDESVIVIYETIEFMESTGQAESTARCDLAGPGRRRAKKLGDVTKILASIDPLLHAPLATAIVRLR